MAVKSLFPDDMMKSSASEGLTLDSIAAKLTYFHEQLHLLHWQTTSYAEHQALGGLYDYVHDFKDGLEIALDTIKSGMSYSLFEDFVRYCGDVKKIKELE